MGADLQASPEDGRVEAESTLPQTVADHRCGAVGPAAPEYRVVGWGQYPSVNGAYAEEIEVVARRQLAAHLLRCALVNRDLDGARGKRRDAGERPVVIAQELETRIRRCVASKRAASGVVDEKETLRLDDRQGLDQHGIDQTEDGGVRPDPQSERQQRHRGKRRRSPQRAQRITQVGPKVVDQPPSNRVATVFLPRGDAAELRPGARRRVGGGKASAPQISLVQLDV